MHALDEYGGDKMAIAGGVASNGAFRKAMEEACEKRGVKFYRPSPILCTDNAAMIACAAYYMSEEGLFSDLSLDAYPVLDLSWCRHMN
jgi:N6-L-threonylcarbamoyladenine synthase